jgi:hypothetical protein
MIETTQERVRYLLEGSVSVPFKRYLHISFKRDLEKQIIVPKLPDSIIEYLEDLKTNPGLKNNLEDFNTPRFCMAETLDGCLNALGHLLKLLDEHPCLNFYVYTNREEIKKMYDSEYLTKHRKVFDAHETGEVWVLEPLRVKMLGKFSISKKNINYFDRTTLTAFNDKRYSPVEDMNHYKYKKLPKFDPYSFY